MSVACTSINHEPVSSSILGNEKETNVFNSSLNKPNGSSFNQITNETHVVTPAVLENWINVTTNRVSVSTKQDEAYAAHSHPGKNKLSYSAVTQGKELGRRPAVEQLAMTGTRLAIQSE